MKRVTMPPEPWDVAPRGAEPVILAPAPVHIRRLIMDAFTGDVGPADLKYMARALLQMSDEIFELRERMAAMDQALKVLAEKDRGG